ncbi:hypothetical protein GOC83_09910 [Haloarcula rubripromontorii]|uniref:Uncharacterized protein n=1 Tax=Haloarcula rubripromontorii TaxID=1705562 RepID=A0A847TKF3_9EURY|nr:hypothetical protein [Haloarcula rubripromontorii]NLV06442.1 hypothetical protein [Haloarcula rubripromontorii]
MALLYVNETEASLDWADVAAGEVIREGEFVVQNANGELEQFDPANDALPHGIVVHYAEGDSIVEHDEDYVAYDDLWTYNGDDGDRAYYQPLAAVNSIMPRSIEEQTSPSSSEPSFSQGTVVGIVTLGSGETRIVPSGYTYDGVTYSEKDADAGAFMALGRVNKYPQELRIQSAYDQRIPVRLDADLFTA